MIEQLIRRGSAKAGSKLMKTMTEARTAHFATGSQRKLFRSTEKTQAWDERFARDARWTWADAANILAKRHLHRGPRPGTMKLSGGSLSVVP